MSELDEIEYLKPRWNHQKEGEERAVEGYLKAKAEAKKTGTHPNFGFGYFFDPGTGKTGTTINTLRRFFAIEERIMRTIIFCPPIVVPNWKEEFSKFSKINQKQIILLRGPGAKRVKTFDATAFDHHGKPQGMIFVTNYEALLMKDLFHRMNEWAAEVVILDESHRIKNHAAKRTKQIDILVNPSDPKLKRNVPRPATLLLSGSPILNSPMDIFSQFLALDGGETFGANFFAFRAKYFRDANANMPSQRHFPNWVPMPGSLKDIQTKITAKSMRAIKKDCLDLPPLLKQKIRLEMAPEQSRLYNEMKTDLVTYLKDEACVAQLAITKALRLMQICSGFVKVEDGTDIELEENPKAEALEELLEDLAPNHKVIVWAVYQQNYKTIRRICEKLKIKYVEVHGEVSEKQKKQNVVDFNTKDDVRIFIGNPQAGGIGINLVESSYAVRYSRRFSLEDILQSEARNYRGGSEKHESITHIDLVMQETLDEIAHDKMIDKEEISFALLQQMKFEFK